MSRSSPAPPPREIPDWAVYWDRDRNDDRRRLHLALGCAFALHAALLAIRFAEGEPATSPQPDAIIFPTHNVAVKEPEKAPPPEPVSLPSETSPVKIPVPAELAPPEPRVEERPSDFAVEVPIAVVSASAIPERPEPLPAAPIRVSGDMVRPVRVSGREPAYTEAARRTRTQGVVVLDAVIDTEGRVTEIDVLRSLGFGLTESALGAVRDWRFEPATLDGRPVTVRYNLTVRFSLR